MRSMVELLNRSPAEHEHSSGPRYSIVEGAMSAQGFTAVNGLDRRQPALPSESTHKQTTESQPNNNQVAMVIQHGQENTQPLRQPSMRTDSVLCSEPPIKESPDTAKRKRLIADTTDEPTRNPSLSGEALSPKRRMTDAGPRVHSHTPSEPTLSLLNTRVSIEPSNRERCSRERSPVPTRNQRVAPPQVRPETEAHLAESLATHLQDAYKHTPANEGPNAPVSTRYNESPIEAYSPEDAGEASGKRKRVFSNRTKSGCHTCRYRKKKCDEAKPFCNNCNRGGFDCTGYGPKPLGYKGPSASTRPHIPLQSKAQDLPRQSTSQSSDGPRYDHWGRVPPTPTAQEPQHHYYPTQSSYEARRSHSRDILHSSSWPPRENESSYISHGLPPVDYAQPLPPVAHYDPRLPHESWRHSAHSPHHSIPSQVATISSRESISTHSSRNPPITHLTSSEMSEKYKMLTGESYKAHIDDELLDDRRSCKAAVERWNQAHDYSRATSDEEKGRLFKAILDPTQRPDPNYQYRDVPASYQQSGTIGSRVIIDNPFTCDYGYNIHIADDVYIGANCTMEDPCDIFIGRRVHIGKNVHFCGNAISDDPLSRKGSQSSLVAGAIIVEDDVNIGPGTIVLPHRVIGKGASVAAGSVVTRVCLSGTQYNDFHLTDMFAEHPSLHHRSRQPMPSHQIDSSARQPRVEALLTRADGFHHHQQQPRQCQQ